jgi:hypothetical protein
MDPGIERLLVNGCSYMTHYSLGKGHIDLADRLGIKKATTVAARGRCNNRIIRTTIQDMYTTDKKTLYVLGLTFLIRIDLPLNQHYDEIDGHWESLLHKDLIPKRKDFWFPCVDSSQISTYLDLYRRFSICHDDMCRSVVKDLVYRLTVLIDSAKRLGHRMLIFRAVESTHWTGLQDLDLRPFVSRPEMVKDLIWCSIPWQIEQGAQCLEEDHALPAEFRHVKAGQHGFLNDFLFDYINDHEILR